MDKTITRNSELPKLNPLEMESLILNQLASVGQKPVAIAVGVDESKMTRLKQGDFSLLCKVLAELKLQLAPPDAVLVRRDYLFSMETLAEIGMKAERMRPEPLGFN